MQKCLSVRSNTILTHFTDFTYILNLSVAHHLLESILLLSRIRISKKLSFLT